MNLNNIKIKVRLLAGFILIVLFVITITFIGLRQTGRIWKESENMYNHPFEVSKAIRDVRANILAIRLNMVHIAQDPQLPQETLNRYIAEIDSCESEVFRSFTILTDRYLGPPEDITTALTRFKSYKSLRDRAITLRINGDTRAASDFRMKYEVPFIETMLKDTRKIYDYAQGKSVQLYDSARKQFASLRIQLIIACGLLALFTILILFSLSVSIIRPIKSLGQATEEFKSGNLNSRCDFKSRDEFGALSASYNSMADSISSELKLRERIAAFNLDIIGENDMQLFCRRLISNLVSETGSVMGAVYLFDREKRHYNLYESIGLDPGKARSFSAEAMEGEIGAVLSEKKIIRHQSLPESTKFLFPAVAGNYVPTEIISIPVLENDEVTTVISLAALKPYSEEVMRFINDIHINISARMSGVMNFRRISEISEKLDSQNRELAEKSKELIIQTDELKEFNIELEIQKKQLDEANRMKSAFLSNMSHELRTPLNSVIALSGVLARRLSGKIPGNEFNYLGIIEKNGKNLLNLINDILDISRIESGKEEVNYSEFFPGEIIKDITDSAVAVAEEKNITVSSFIEPDVPEMISDKKKCQHILQNIISNAVKFTENGSVRVTASADRDNLIVNIKDTGIGIKPEFMPFLFDEFRQADDKASRKFGGSGLGLAIAKKYCDILNGNINVYSVPDEGSEFIVTLPLRPKNLNSLKIDRPGEKKKLSGTENNPGNLNPSDTKTILLVEDSEPQIIQISDILQTEGFNLKVAHNGREALELIGTSIPDAMILDLQMPDIDGFEVLEKIKTMPGASQIPVIILSAKHISSADLVQFNGNNIHQLVQKGNITRNDLITYIKKIFDPHLHNHKPEKRQVKDLKKTGSDSEVTVLIIEDNPDNLITFMALLEGRNRVVSAGSGEEGIEKAKEEKPSLVLLDISLPGMDGFTVLEKLKNLEGFNDVPVIALTARAMKGDREDLLNHGFDGYISKPVDHTTFQNTVNEYLTHKLSN